MALPRGGYFFKVVIFIKFKKYIVVALAVLSVIVASILPCSAVTVPNYNITDDENTHYTVVSYNNGIELVFLSVGDLAVVQTSNMTYLNNPNGYWVRKIELPANNDGTDHSGTLCSWSPGEAQIVSANYDVKFQGSDKVFFQQPTLLSNLLKQVPQGVGERVAADSLTLTICGISLIALLIGCALVPKVLYRFL